jgi:hypothetical protein
MGASPLCRPSRRLSPPKIAHAFSWHLLRRRPILPFWQDIWQDAWLIHESWPENNDNNIHH